MRYAAPSQLQIVLDVIERIAGDDFCCDLEMEVHLDPKSRDTFKIEVQRKFSYIYRLAHAFSPSHPCYHAHNDWRNLLGEFVQHRTERHWGNQEVRSLR